MSRDAALEREFPGLRSGGYEVSSAATPAYNCIAWALGDTSNVWWPDRQRQCEWPRLTPREWTIDAFVLAFATFGYTLSDNSNLETGIEKVALYALNAKPMHASRQLDDGMWTSKCGRDADIRHELAALEGSEYGKVTAILARPRQADRSFSADAESAADTTQA